MTSGRAGTGIPDRIALTPSSELSSFPAFLEGGSSTRRLAVCLAGVSVAWGRRDTHPSDGNGCGGGGLLSQALLFIRKGLEFYVRTRWYKDEYMLEHFLSSRSSFFFFFSDFKRN